MSSVDPADPDFASAHSVDLTDLNDAALRQRGASEANSVEADGA